MKEVGIRKIIGAKRSRLILQYAGRSMLLAFSSLAIALMIVLLLLPSFNTITGKHLSLQVNASFITALFVITFITGVISGSYPALYLSGFKPALVLKGKLSPVVGEVWVRKGLVVFQFAISVFLIISVLVIQGQVNLVQTKNLGYNKDNIIHFASDGKLRNGLELFTSEIKKMPGVVNASSMDGNMTGVYSQGGGGISWPGKGLNEGVEFTGLDMDYGMMEMLELQVSEGRAFSQQFADSNSVIFNESAIKAMHLDRPVGKTVTLWGAKKQIIGIVKDFQFGSMYKKTGPFFLRCTPNNSSVFVKIKRGTEKQTLARLEKFYKQYNEGLPFEYTFMDDDYNALYASEQRVSELSKYFAGLAIIISCLGLFGLVAFTAQKRRKEIGIRKVTGASVISIILLLSKDFIRLVIIALATALPLAWWVLHNWLQGFAYRVTISSGMFFIAALCVISIALLTICVQAIKAAMANPVAALRAE
jgi:ABC-type antimicrobial peptide transport system permease subunit